MANTTTTSYISQHSTVYPTTKAQTTPPVQSNTTQGIDLPLGGSLLVINICIVIFNVYMIAVILRFRTKNAVDIFVLALATTDLIKGLVPVPMSVYIYLTEWSLVEGKL